MAKHISYSELRDARQCPLKHKLAWRDGWRATTERAALSRGRLFHEVLAAHYAALMEGREPDQAALAALEAAGEETRELVAWMYEGYREYYGADENWTVLAVEKRDNVWLRTPRGTRSGYELTTVLDLLVADRMGRVWIVDHKTAADFPSQLNLELDDQLTLYQWGVAQRGLDVYGVIYNLARTRRNKKPMALEERFRRVSIYRTAEQLTNTALDAWRTARRAGGDAYREPAPDKDACVWRCDFTEACLYARKGGRIEEFLASQGFEKRERNGNGNGRAKENS